MARAKPRSGTAGSERSASESKAEKATEVVSDEENEDGEEDGSEYEIEEIIDAKRGVYPDGRMAYFVKWKGYDVSENSWVDEKDAVGAVELVEDYWKKQQQKKNRKSIGADTKSRKPRKSAVESTVESEEGTPAPKKRGRKSNVPKADSDGEKEPEEDRSVKKPRKSLTAAEKKAAASKKAASEEMEVDEEAPPVGNMKKYMNTKNWEELVSTIDTVERVDDNLYVYFTLSTGEQVRETSEICGERFPRKMLKFYENNLRWRTADEMQEA
ncbi:hypothetical protein BDQ17DRAFT_1361908 [Cyathus striatus]|nr:hypothetical protein BDQ17DRAFT_1361908 [Cyathus striatus]